MAGGELMPRKAKQPRLLPRLEPITSSDGLTFADLITHYRCQCGHTAETGIKLEAIVCTRCGGTMRPTEARGREPPSSA